MMPGLEHFLDDCPGMARYRAELAEGADQGTTWAFEQVRDVDQLARRVKFVGLSLSLLVNLLK